MKKRFTSIVLLIAIAGGVAAGMPLHSGGHGKMSSCCKKAKSGEQSAAANAARLCCAANCTDLAGTTSGPSVPSPVVLKATQSAIERNWALLPAKRVSRTFHSHSENNIRAREHLPLFLRHHSFLI